MLRPRPHATDPGRCEFDKLSLVRFADPHVAAQASGGRSPSVVKEILGPGRTALRGDSERGRRDGGRGRGGGEKPADYVRPTRDVFDHEAIIGGAKTMTDTIDQDIELLGQVQAGMASAGFADTWLNDDEMRIQHFHNRVEALLGARAK